MNLKVLLGKERALQQFLTHPRTHTHTHTYIDWYCSFPQSLIGRSRQAPYDFLFVSCFARLFCACKKLQTFKVCYETKGKTLPGTKTKTDREEKGAMT